MLDQEKLKNYGKAGRLRAIANFSWDSIAKETVDLYQRVLNKS
jgi:glycosyltransferase involved in cell wall biosynthesis